jgi:hypothetical protein
MLSGQILKGSFKWDMNTNLTYTKNKLLSLDGVLDMKINNGGANTGKVMHALIVGQPVSAFYMLRQDGIYQTDLKFPSNFTTREYVQVIANISIMTETETYPMPTECM